MEWNQNFRTHILQFVKYISCCFASWKQSGYSPATPEGAPRVPICKRFIAPNGNPGSVVNATQFYGQEWLRLRLRGKYHTAKFRLSFLSCENPLLPLSPSRPAKQSHSFRPSLWASRYPAILLPQRLMDNNTRHDTICRFWSAPFSCTVYSQNLRKPSKQRQLGIWRAVSRTTTGTAEWKQWLVIQHGSQTQLLGHGWSWDGQGHWANNDHIQRQHAGWRSLP